MNHPDRDDWVWRELDSGSRIGRKPSLATHEKESNPLFPILAWGFVGAVLVLIVAWWVVTA